jgi:hypothetical protein
MNVPANTTPGNRRHEFKAVLDGIDLPPEVVDRISHAVQQAVLAELVTIDTRGDFVLRLAMEEPTRGIEARILAPEEARQVASE